MAYIRNTWVNNETQLNASNMNNIEDGIVEALDGIDTTQTICKEYTDTEVENAITKTLNTPVGGGKEPVLQEKEVIPSKSQQTVTPDAGYDGLSKVKVGSIPNDYIIPSGTQQISTNGTYDVSSNKFANVNVPSAKDEVEKTVDITENGTQDVVPDAGKVFSKITINTNIPSSEKEEQEKTVEITENQVYTILPDENKALSKVIANVNVPSSGGTELNIAYSDTPPTDTSKLWIKSAKPENIMFSRNIEQQIQNLTSLDKYLSEKASYIAAAAVGTKIYLFGGSIGAAEYLDTIQEFDIETKTRSTLSAKLLIPAHLMAAAAVGTKIYLFGGYGGGYLDTIQEFDTEEKTIAEITAASTSMIPAESMAAAAVGTKIYLFGGYGGDYLDTILEFDTERKKIKNLTEEDPKIKLLAPAESMAAAAVGTKVYLFGGIAGSDYLDTILEFDTDSKTIKNLAEEDPTIKLPMVTNGMAAVAVGTMIYLFGCITDSSDYFGTILEFNAETKTISTFSKKLPIEVGGVAAGAAGMKIYLFGGHHNGFSNAIQECVVNFMLTTNNIFVREDWDGTFVDIVPAPTKVTIGVKNVYKGDTNNFAEFVDAYLYNGTNWVNINTQEIYTIGSD